MAKTYYVAKNGLDSNRGTEDAPFLTIQRAADIAVAGDTVMVHEGIYREWVRPQNGGSADNCRITYTAAPGEHVAIKGSEQISNWVNVEGTVWKTVLPNSFFGEENPYSLKVCGDWFEAPMDPYVHRGEVYLNGRALYEALYLEDVYAPKMRTHSCYPTWQGRCEQIPDPDWTVYQWFAQVDNENTEIYANFHGADPNVELVEINVRSACFYPEKTNLNYITVKGFEMAQAACPWTPPTSHQLGLLGCHWSKGWIIENNHIHDAKCSAISVGKEASTGDNEFTKTGKNPGYQHQMESVFEGRLLGWTKEQIGSHIIRNNVIHDCGQTAIVGHMGCAFGEIYGNEIYNIALKHEYYGHEIAGIKFHSAVDTYIHHNYIHHCSLGIWLDWEAQGTRVSGNIFTENNRDLMIEVTHGPHLVDNNILGSDFSLVNAAQGGAYVHNLICGFMERYPVLNRATPYHFPHCTDVLGVSVVYGGDDRWYQNMFATVHKETVPYAKYGTADYAGAPTSETEYLRRVKSLGVGDVEHYERTTQPAYINGNVYYNGAPTFEEEKNRLSFEKKLPVKLEDDGQNVYLHIVCDADALTAPGQIITTDILGSVRIVQQRFENPDGTKLSLHEDMLGQPRGSKPIAGPLENLIPGNNRIQIWSRGENL